MQVLLALCILARWTVEILVVSAVALVHTTVVILLALIDTRVICSWWTWPCNGQSVQTTQTKVSHIAVPRSAVTEAVRARRCETGTLHSTKLALALSGTTLTCYSLYVNHIFENV